MTSPFDDSWQAVVASVERAISMTPRLLAGPPQSDENRRLAAMGIDRPGELVEWFSWQGGLDPDCGVRSVFDGFAPRSLTWVEEWWSHKLEMHAEIEADDPDLDYAVLEYWPKPGWFPVDLMAGYTVIDTCHRENPGRVLRAWPRQLDIIATDLNDFLRGGAQRVDAGDTTPELSAR